MFVLIQLVFFTLGLRTSLSPRGEKQPGVLGRRKQYTVDGASALQVKSTGVPVHFIIHLRWRDNLNCCLPKSQGACVVLGVGTTLCPARSSLEGTKLQ